MAKSTVNKSAPKGRTAKRKPQGGVRMQGAGRRIGRFIAGLIALAIVIPVIQTAVLKFVPPPVTILMIQRLIEGKGLDKSWRSIDQI